MKYLTHVIPTRKNVGHTKCPRKKMLDPRNTHKKIFGPARKYFGPTKYPRENILNLRNTHDKKFRTHEITTRKNFGLTKARWHGGKRPTEFSTLYKIFYQFLTLETNFFLINCNIWIAIVFKRFFN